MSVVVRVDQDVYNRLLEIKHELEREEHRIVSMSEAVAALIVRWLIT